MLMVFDNDSIRRILSVRRRDCVPPVELRRRLCLTKMPSQRRLRWFSHAARRPDDPDEVVMQSDLRKRRLTIGMP